MTANPYRLTLRQRFALHCALTDTAKSGATRAALAAKRSGMDWTTTQMRQALEALLRRGLVAKPTPGHYVITDKGRGAR
jgi:predicted transcriptional regulator